MHDYTSRQLFLANGGNKLYIYKDGFGDVYSATPAEEAAWTKEIIANALLVIETEQNRSQLQLAISNLVFHHYENIKLLLIQKIEGASPARQIAFATELWNISRYEKSFDIIYKCFLQHRSECMNDVFLGLNDMKENESARNFLIACLDGEDEMVRAKAQSTLSSWSRSSGMTLLKENNLVDLLDPKNKNTDGSSTPPLST